MTLSFMFCINSQNYKISNLPVPIIHVTNCLLEYSGFQLASRHYSYSVCDWVDHLDILLLLGVVFVVRGEAAQIGRE